MITVAECRERRAAARRSVVAGSCLESHGQLGTLIVSKRLTTVRERRALGLL